MKISELIAVLSNALAKHGDLEVEGCYETVSQILSTNDISVVSYETAHGHRLYRNPAVDPTEKRLFIAADEIGLGLTDKESHECD
jgi:hypothetical protein